MRLETRSARRADRGGTRLSNSTSMIAPMIVRDDRMGSLLTYQTDSEVREIRRVPANSLVNVLRIPRQVSS